MDVLPGITATRPQIKGQSTPAGNWFTAVYT